MLCPYKLSVFYAIDNRYKSGIWIGQVSVIKMSIKNANLMRESSNLLHRF